MRQVTNSQGEVVEIESVEMEGLPLPTINYDLADDSDRGCGDHPTANQGLPLPALWEQDEAS